MSRYLTEAERGEVAAALVARGDVYAVVEEILAARTEDAFARGRKTERKVIMGSAAWENEVGTPTVEEVIESRERAAYDRGREAVLVPLRARVGMHQAAREVLLARGQTDLAVNANEIAAALSLAIQSSLRDTEKDPKWSAGESHA